MLSSAFGLSIFSNIFWLLTFRVFGDIDVFRIGRVSLYINPLAGFLLDRARSSLMSEMQYVALIVQRGFGIILPIPHLHSVKWERLVTIKKALLTVDQVADAVRTAERRIHRRTTIARPIATLSFQLKEVLQERFTQWYPFSQKIILTLIKKIPESISPILERSD